MNDKFIARYSLNGSNRSYIFDKSKFTTEQAEVWLKSQGINNFFMLFEPNEPQPIGENGMMFSGEVGFDITINSIMPHVENGKEIILHTDGGDLFEGWRIHDAIKLSGLNPSIGVVGFCASAAVQILLSTENRWMSENSSILIHNPWAVVAGDDTKHKNMANMLEKEKIKLANYYSNISGKPVDEILDIMTKEVFINSTEAQAMNFVKSVKINVEPINENEMDKKELESSMSEVKNMFSKIMNLFKPKNIMIQDVNGKELDFGELETAEQIAVGVTATVDGEAANGEYTLADGTIYVFENGTLREIKKPEPTEPEMDALKKENEDLKVENSLLKEDYATLKNEFAKFKNDTQAQVTEAMSKYNNLVNQFSTLNIVASTPGTPEPVKRKAYK